MSEEIKAHKVIIIGSGGAGYTTAIYTSRAMLEPLLFSGVEIGGQLATTTDVENYPGFPNGIQGPELMQKFKKQAERFGTEIINANVDRVDFSGNPKKLWSQDKEYRAEAIIIATGASSVWLNLPSEQKLRGRGVSSCATCDGFFFKGKDVVVIGGGDSAMEEALFLTKFAHSVIVIHRRDELRASKYMQERAKKNTKISFVWNSEVTHVHGEDAMSAVTVKNNKTGEPSRIEAQGMFVAIGHKPNTALFKGQIELDEKGYIIAKEYTMTSVGGVFVAGDVRDHRYRQAITAAGEGCKAAIDAERWLESRG